MAELELEKAWARGVRALHATLEEWLELEWARGLGLSGVVLGGQLECLDPSLPYTAKVESNVNSGARQSF